MTTHRVDNFDLPGEAELTRVDVEGTTVAVTVVDGVLHAVDDQCTHQQCSLSDGEVEGGAILCPCHFGRFDLRTGAVVEGPPPRPIRVWHATITDGTLELRQ